MVDDPIKEFFNACHDAKRIVELIPPLPEGMTPRHIRVIDAVHQCSEARNSVRVSDISDALHATRPSITKLINELQQMQVLTKKTDASDKRVVLLELTETGKTYYDFYIQKFYAWLGVQLADLRAEDLHTGAQTIRQVLQILSTHSMDLSDCPGCCKKGGIAE